MGAFDKFLNYMKINDDDFYEEDDYPVNEPKPEKKSVPQVKDDAEAEDRPIRKSGVNKVTNMAKAGRRPAGPSNMEVVRIKPKSVEDGKKISDLLLENKVVFLDLEGIDMNLAQRIVDFTSGATYAIDGTLQQMSKYTFVIT
ncbi:MAG: cell division protein SepF, partial [Lachnospiraceae bacterium]|nr:cell division protein SepF [Lachnospiraceae bacterium]